MKSIVILVIVSILVVQVQELLGEKRAVPSSVIRMVKKYSKLCRAKTNVTDYDLSLIKQLLLPEQRSGLRYLECMLEKFGVIVYGQFRKTSILKAIGPVIPDTDNMRKKWEQIGDECEKEIKRMDVNESGDLAKNVIQCLRKYEDACPVKLPLEHLR